MNRHVLVVGGTRGLGRAFARACALDGCAVSVLARRRPAPGQRLEGADYLAADILDLRQARAALLEAVRRRGRLDSLVFFQRYRGASWESELATALTATKNLIELAAARFKPAGSIVIAGSVANRFVADECSAGYHVAKAGQEQLVRYYAATLGPRGIRVNGVCPCTVEKDENRDYFRRHRALRGLYEGLIPLRRLGTAAEVAQAVSFLAGPQASFITGQNIVVDGGLSLLWQESLARKAARK